MKSILAGLFILVSQTLFAQTGIEHNLTCTYTKMNFNAIPEVIQVFKFVEKSGYVPRAEGVFRIPSENIMVFVSSEIINVPEQNTEYINTGITININQASISTSFSKKINEQLSYMQIDNSGVVLCTVN